MSRRTLTPQQEKQAQQLADDLRDQASEVFREVSEILSTVPDEQLFGDTEFLVRQKVIKLVADAYTARLAQKKTATSAAASTVPTASEPRPSTATATARP